MACRHIAALLMIGNVCFTFRKWNGMSGANKMKREVETGK